LKVNPSDAADLAQKNNTMILSTSSTEIVARNKARCSHRTSCFSINGQAVGIGSFLFFFYILCLVIPASNACGNPIMVGWGLGGSAERWLPENSFLAAMASEDVTITVDSEQSTVRGRYTFHAERVASFNFWRGFEVFVPVLLTEGQIRQYEKSNGRPSVSLNGRRLNAILTEVGPAPFLSASLPSGWRMVWFKSFVPREIVKSSRNIEVTVSYAQPNFSDGSAGYVPLHPSKKKGSSRVLFKGGNDLLLRPSGLFSFLSKSRPQLEYVPMHRKLIRVRWVANALQGNGGKL
jgi:hypothetical protein